MTLSDLVAGGLMLLGIAFFVTGTLGLLRFPDIYTRLHALTKADNLGLGFTILGIALSNGSVLFALKLVFIWALVMLSSAAASQLIAERMLRDDVQPWTKL